MVRENGYPTPQEDLAGIGQQVAFDADYECIGAEDKQYERDYPMSKNTRYMFIALLVFVCGLLVLYFQQGKLAELRVQEANTLAQMILIQEESLSLYGISPDMVPELCILREAWFNDHTSKSAENYSDALTKVLDYLKENCDITKAPGSIETPKTPVVMV